MGISCKKYVGRMNSIFAKAENDYEKGKANARRDAARSARSEDNKSSKR